MKRFVLAIVFIAMGILPAAGGSGPKTPPPPGGEKNPKRTTQQPRPEQAVHPRRCRVPSMPRNTSSDPAI